MSEPSAAAAAVHANMGRGPGVISNEARSMARDLLDAPIPIRRQVIRDLGGKELAHVMRETQRETGALYGLWHDTPSGFVEDVCGETMWSKQAQVLDALVDHKRVIVPAGFGVGKTHLAGRATAWFVCTNPIGTGLVVTTATRFRQVRNQLWPHIRKVVARAQLPGVCDTVQWKVPDMYGNEVQVAYGFSAPDNDEAAMQGIHAIRLLLIVDEAGGISKMVGEGTNNLLTGDARMLAIGNPAMDDPGSWFEDIAEEGFRGDEPTTTSIRIATSHSPAITGETTDVCRECPPNPHDVHTISRHMPDKDWMDRTIRAYGEEHPYVIAKVMAEFPKDAGNKILPTSWVEGARNNEDPSGREYHPLADIGVENEYDKFTVRRGAWVRLGVDVAAAGGDEFAIYRAIGDVVHKRHTSSGSANANSVVVATKVLDEILQAQKVADVLGSRAQIRVKVDTIGVGWGVVGLLQEWGKLKKHKAQIVPVNVSETPENDHSGGEMVPFRKRDEMWLAMRSLLQPDPSTGEGRLRLRVDEVAAAQLSVPNFSNQAGGMVQVESKASMKARGRKSPDRAEAALLAVYEPVPIVRGKRRGIIGGGG